MCGIIGFLGEKLPSRDLFEKARDSMIHRGSDDQGIFYSPKEGVALGHRRLSIIDLSPAGHQPMISNDRRYLIVFNGEIYNYQELKNELSKNYQFKTKTDTEVLLAAYSEWGEKFLEKLNGMFAFAIWDSKEKKLIVARDRLGIKPLYYSQEKGNFCFASEAKGILNLMKLERKLNKQGLLDYLSYRQVLGNGTLFEGIYSLLPAHYLVFDTKKKGFKLRKYWDLPNNKIINDPGEKKVLETVEQLLGNSVKMQMISDVSLGAFLSGGLDSSVLVALMAKYSEKKVKTFSLGFEEDGFSELPYARQVSKFLNTDHHEVILKGMNYLDLMPELIKFKDFPLSTHNEIALYALSKELKKDITVVLSGDGADELFAGYGRIFRSSFDFDRMKILGGNNQMKREERKILLENLQKKYGGRIYKHAYEHFISQYTYFPDKAKRSILNKPYFNQEKKNFLNEDYFKHFFSENDFVTTFDQYLAFFQKVHILAPIARLDNSTMGASIEARVPYMDHQLVEYVFSLPEKYKLHWKSVPAQNKSRLLNSNQISEKFDTPKYLLRKIGLGLLPTDIVRRKKMGFPAPLDHWFSGKFYDYARELLLSYQARSRSLYNTKNLSEWLNASKAGSTGLSGMNIWMLVNIELWMKAYDVQT